MVDFPLPATGPLAWLALAFVLGGLVKGTLGIGLPMVALPLLSFGWHPMQAIALVAVPVVASNLWQAWDTGISAQGVRRFLPLMATLVLSTALMVPYTLGLPEATLRTLLAAAVLLTVALNALPLCLHVPPQREPLYSAVVGALSGVMGGLSSITGPIIISYLVSLRLPREVFVGSISVIYLAGALPLYGSMAVQGRFAGRELLLSLLALLPMALGLAAGKRLRGHLNEALFRRLLLGFLTGLALLLIFN
jgi:uncharacterized protein